jgi:hypothetical protein
MEMEGDAFLSDIFLNGQDDHVAGLDDSPFQSLKILRVIKISMWKLWQVVVQKEPSGQ